MDKALSIRLDRCSFKVSDMENCSSFILTGFFQQNSCFLRKAWNLSVRFDNNIVKYLSLIYLKKLMIIHFQLQMPVEFFLKLSMAIITLIKATILARLLELF